MLENKSGYFPMGYNVLVTQEKVQEKIGSIFIPDEHKDRQQFKVGVGVIVAVGELAWTLGKPNDPDFWSYQVRPTVGTKVKFTEYAGEAFTGKDDERYLILQDRDILAIEEKAND
jgi:co-chaperonin GroES (HSP10)